MNKKTGKLLILFLFVILIPFAVMATGCGKKVTDVKLISMSDTYEVGQELAAGDFVIAVTYSDDTTENITVTNEMLNEVLPKLTEEGTYTINVTYEGTKYSIVINVTDPYKVEGMSVINYRENYETYDTFTANGSVKIVYVSDTTEDLTVDITDDMILEQPDMTTPGRKNIIVNYEGTLLTYTINVTERTVTNYVFSDNIRKSYYTTTDSDEITVAGGSIEITYSNGTTETLILDDEMLFFVPEFGSEADYNIVVKIGDKDYNLVVTVTTDPKVAEYEKLVTSIQELVEASMMNNAEITASILLKLNTKVMGETKEINENHEITFNVDDIKDMYLNALVADTIKAILDSTGEIADYDDISYRLNLDIYEILNHMYKNYLNTASIFDYYTYINSNRQLSKIKDEIANMIAAIINEITFGFSRYTVEVNFETHEWTTRPNEVYYDLVDIVDTIIIKGIVQREDFREEFLEAYRDYATKVSAEDPKIATACINNVDYVLNHFGDTNMLSTFIRMMDELHKAIYETAAGEGAPEYTSNAPVYADLVEILEIYYFQTAETPVTFEEMATEFDTVITTAISEIENPEDIPYSFVFINYISSMMVDKRNIAPVCTAIAFDIADSILLDNIESLAHNIEPLNNTINNYRGYAQYFTDMLETIDPEEDPDTYYYYKSQVAYYQDLADDYSKSLEEIEKSLAILTNIETSLMSVKEIIIGYVHDIAFGEEVNYFDLAREIATALELDEKYFTMIDEYETSYNENGVAYILRDLFTSLADSYGPMIQEYIGPDETEHLFGILIAIGTRIDERNIVDTPFSEDLVELVADVYGIELESELAIDRESELKQKLTYMYLTNYSEMIDMAIISGLKDVFDIEEVPEELFETVDSWVTANIEYYYNDGEEVDNLVYAYNIATMLELDDIATLINNKIEYDTFKFAQYVVSNMRESALKEYENDIPENIDALLTSLNQLATVVDTYHLYEDEEVAMADLKEALRLTMNDLRICAIAYNEIEPYVITEIYNIIMLDLDEEAMIAEIEKTIYAFEFMVGADVEFSVENYNDVFVFVSTIYDATETGKLSDEVVIKAVLNSNVATTLAIEVLSDALDLTEEGTLELTAIIEEIKTGIDSEEFNVQATAQRYFDFARIYAGENAPVLYGIGVATLVYYEQEVDYNELFKDVTLPEGMPADIDYNKIINILVTKEKLEEAIKFTCSGLNEVITHTEEGDITTQELMLSLTLNFDVTFIVLDGSLNLNLGINYITLR